jgi:D-tyrosyl-tRNA(Tyr) deacylase
MSQESHPIASYRACLADDSDDLFAMIGLLQRVSEAEVTIEGQVIGSISDGLLVFLAIEPGDTATQTDRLVERLLGYRVFPDPAGRMNLSLLDTRGGLLLVPQFTLAADTDQGRRPSFGSAAAPEHGRALFERATTRARLQLCDRVATGQFGAHMQVRLTNDGPVTFWLRVPPVEGKV